MVPFKGWRGPAPVSMSDHAVASDTSTIPQFAFHVKGTASEMDGSLLRIVGDTLDAITSLHAPEEAMREFQVLAKHDPAFEAFVREFRFDLHESERLAVLRLFKSRPAELPVADLADALEFVSRYRDILPASRCCMRFYQALHFFSPQAADAFANALKVAPLLEPEKVFRNIAMEHGVTDSYRRIPVAHCISYFNQERLIEGLEAFHIENYICIRKKNSTMSINYAEAVVASDEFARFIICLHTDPRHLVLDLLRENGARASLCCSLIRCYLKNYHAEEALLVAELLATVRGRPPFISMPKFLIETKRGLRRPEPVLRLAKDRLPPAHAEVPKAVERPAMLSKA